MPLLAAGDSKSGIGGHGWSPDRSRGRRRASTASAGGLTDTAANGQIASGRDGDGSAVGQPRDRRQRTAGNQKRIVGAKREAVDVSTSPRLDRDRRRLGVLIETSAVDVGTALLLQLPATSQLPVVPDQGPPRADADLRAAQVPAEDISEIAAITSDAPCTRFAATSFRKPITEHLAAPGNDGIRHPA